MLLECWRAREREGGGRGTESESVAVLETVF